MAYHIPFAHRRRGCPIYIGFDEMPIRRRSRFNGWALSSAAVLGLSFGALAPVALICGLIGMRKSPRTLATFTTLISGVITAMMCLGVAFVAKQHSEHMQRVEAARVRHVHERQIEATQVLLGNVESKFDQFRFEHSGELPAAYEGMLISVQHVDPWKTPLRYDIDNGVALLRSAGPDRRFNSRDDVTRKLGAVEMEISFASGIDD